MNPVQMFKVYELYRKFTALNALGGSMTTGKIAQYLHLFVSLAGTIGIPTLASNWLQTHAVYYFAVVNVSIFLHAISPSIFGGPSDADKKATGLTAVALILGMLLLGATTASAQTTATAPALSPTITSDAIGYYSQKSGSWFTGTHTTESLTLIQWGTNNANQISVDGHEINTTANVNHYLGGLGYTPDISKLVAKTVLPANTLTLKAYAAIGDGVPSTGTAHVSWIVGVVTSYRLSANLSWNVLEAGYNRYGNSNNGYVSSGLKAYF